MNRKVITFLRLPTIISSYAFSQRSDTIDKPLSIGIITNSNKFKGIEVFKPLESVDTVPVLKSFKSRPGKILIFFAEVVANCRAYKRP